MMHARIRALRILVKHCAKNGELATLDELIDKYNDAWATAEALRIEIKRLQNLRDRRSR